MKSIAMLAVLATAGLLTSCATNGPAIKPGCEWAEPIYISKVDKLTDGTARAILAHNEKWKAICGR